MKYFLSLSLITLLSLSCQLPTEKFSSPEAVVATFITASLEKDKELLSQCFSENSPGEWDELKDKSATDKELEELKEFVTDAVIKKTEQTDDHAAIVYVKFTSRDEKIHTTKENGRWYILDF
ncbi:MAG: hypothetical protein MI810_21360 [Flavobacteriales bacterium]|nr:hypothetical protein [Flavobacteriales bacterium]